MSRKTVAKIMRDNNIRGISPRPWHPVTTVGDDAVHNIPDLVGRRFDRGGLNQVWTSDITYLAMGQGWLYLCAIPRRAAPAASSATPSPTRCTPTWSRPRCAGRCCSRTPATGSTPRAAAAARQQKVIFHADRGCQYTSTQLAGVADEVGVRLSVGRTGVCWDNAQQESFWSTLKTEYYDRYEFATRAEAIHGVTGWIETVYNRRRRHSALGQINPVAFENQLITAAVQAPNRCPPNRGNPNPVASDQNQSSAN